MKFTVLSRMDAKNYLPKGNALIIRMDDNYPYSSLEGDYKAIQEVYFSDVTDKTNPYAITKENAIELINFVKNNIEGVDEIVVHCKYGKGRSPAVAASISMFMFNQNFPIQSYPNINELVFNTIKENVN